METTNLSDSPILIFITVLPKWEVAIFLVTKVKILNFKFKNIFIRMLIHLAKMVGPLMYLAALSLLVQEKRLSA